MKAPNRFPLFWWICLAFGVALVGVVGVLGLAGLVPPWWPWGGRVLDPAVHGGVVTAAVSVFGGVAALTTFFLNREQKERQHRAQLEQERDAAELQRIEAEFAALADDFAQPAPLSRINAAIGLGELARRPDPRRLDDYGNVLDDPRDDGAETYFGMDGDLFDEPLAWPEDWRSKKTDRNYPYFLRAARRRRLDRAPNAQRHGRRHRRTLLWAWIWYESSRRPRCYGLCLGSAA